MKPPATMEQVPPSQEQGKSPSPNENPPSQELASTHPTTHSHVQAEAVIPIERQRVEGARRLDPQRSDPPSEAATSTYSLQESMDDNDDDASFTIVSYKKNRPAGIPILFHPTSQETSFWKVNPNVLAREVPPILLGPGTPAPRSPLAAIYVNRLHEAHCSGYGMGLPISIYRFMTRSPDELCFWKRGLEVW
ncbi:hypothetical protein HPB47_017417 [Ixodes persulcatus]|uniref:Uncharacterized protein n=1 Tax=Ixodes persulcatus TaxID=34615 RepID=A0AC60QND9_IXOPE|nr:hypothetical protein HPB47_017417 [Ixodes persulcatus]